MYRPQKGERYLHRSIQRVAASHLEEKRAIENVVLNIASDPMEKEAADYISVSETPETLLVPPPGMVAELAQWFVNNAYVPIPVYGLAAALSVVAGICGRSYHCNGNGINLYNVIVGHTGVGKDSYSNTGMNDLFQQLVQATEPGMPVYPTAIEFYSAASFASGQGLNRLLKKNAGDLAVETEIESVFSRLATSNLTEATQTLHRMLLALYTTSGPNSVLQGTWYSNTEKNIDPIHCPSFTLHGECTPSVFEHSGGNLLASGLTGRFGFFIYEGGQKYREHTPVPLPQGVRDWLGMLVQTATKNAAVETPDMTEIVMDAEAQKLFNEEARRGTEAYNFVASRLRNKNAVADWEVEFRLVAVTRRSLETALRYASCAAIGINHIAPVVTQELLEWGLRITKGTVVYPTRFYGEQAVHTDDALTAVEDVFRRWVARDERVGDIAEKNKVAKALFHGLAVNIIPRTVLSQARLLYRSLANSKNLKLTLDSTLENLQADGKIQLITDLENIRGLLGKYGISMNKGGRPPQLIILGDDYVGDKRP